MLVIAWKSAEAGSRGKTMDRTPLLKVAAASSNFAFLRSSQEFSIVIKAIGDT